MTIVVTDNCAGCRFTECVSVCPVACFHQDEVMVYIDPSVCINCAACIPKCPVHAIYDAFDLAEDKLHWVSINEEQSLNLPLIESKQTPLPGADERRSALGF